ncbi:MFS transporter [Quadrisphaera sp. DSM 44207]|uniref:MFS transporter n=1 Tax=Quadrisphaera sp. DSM 44207 TaxID=1881057 RepID=UPI001C409766|nr:MFS transporter [Quadrisphaera sp. DSM 44207]
MHQQRLADAIAEGITPVVFARRWLTATAMFISLLSVMLANSSLNLALPQMTTDLEITSTQQTWVVDLYSLVFAALLFTSGAVSDRYGRKLLLQAGVVLFTAAAAYAGFVATSGIEVMVARGVMGLGAAFVMPATLSVINAVFPRGQRASAIAAWTAVAGVGSGIGAIAGGFLLEHFAWQSVFVLSVGFGGAALLANQVLTPESRDEERTAVDWVGGLLSTTGVLGLVYAIVEGPNRGWTAPDILVGMAAAVVGIGAFVAWERWVPNPMLDLALFANPLFTVSSVAALVAFLALSGAFFLLAQVFQLVLGMGSLESALRMLPILVPVLVLSPVATSAWSRLGAKVTIGSGLAVIAGGFLIASAWTADSTYAQIIWPLAVVTAGMTFVMVPATNLVLAAVPRSRSGMGAAMNDTIRELGAALGIAVLGTMIAAGYRDGIATALTALPAPLAEAAEKSFAVAVDGVAPVLVSTAGAPAAHALVDAATQAWVDGLTAAMLTSAVLAVLAAAWTFLAMPRKREEDHHAAREGVDLTATPVS